MQLSTPHLLLRPHRVDDWPAVHAYVNHPEVLRYRPDDLRTPQDIQTHLQLLVAAQQRQPRTSYHFALIVLTEKQLIGWCGLSIKDDAGQIAELGYDLDYHHWGKGYATEAARAVVEFGFTQIGLHRIFAECHPANSASQRVMQKIGMSYEGQLRKNAWVKGSWWDTCVYSILEEEWPAKVSAQERAH
jgi:[ribosomal protein S5]-alanine N-acetyltransferase